MVIDYHPYFNLRSKFFLVTFYGTIKIGGPKFVWEVNRLYWLPNLAFAYAKTYKKIHADRIFELLDNWLEKNPYSYGVNWTSGIELGVRLANVVWVLSLLKGSAVSGAQEKGCIPIK